MDAAAGASPPRDHRFVRDAIVVVVALAVGLGLAAGYSAIRDRGGRGEASARRARSGASSGRTASGYQPTATSGDARLSGSADDRPSPAARTPRDAVRTFLTFEARTDFTGSFGLLAAPDRAATRTRSEWIADHEHLYPVTGFTITRVDTTSDHADVHVALTLRAGIDYVSGVIPARADADLVTLREDGGWRVAYNRSRIVPRYPADSGALDASRAWARDRQACRSAKELSGGLLGATYLADRLCHAGGTVDLGSVGPLPDSPAVEPLLAAFGPKVGEWARVVPVHSPVAMDVVTAPVGESWLVIGVLEASPGSGS